MKSPIELLEEKLASLRYIASSKTNFYKKKARDLIPAYEKAIELLKTYTGSPSS